MLKLPKNIDAPTVRERMILVKGKDDAPAEVVMASVAAEVGRGISSVQGPKSLCDTVSAPILTSSPPIPNFMPLVA
jgi:hypothetical protein